MYAACGPESDPCGIFSFKAVYDAYCSCRRRKRSTMNALRFEADLLENLVDLSEALCTGAYQPLRSVCFITQKPKLREIFAADFRDRVVHHLLVPRLERIFEPKFIHDSYACRQGKGTHAAVNRLRFFMSIDRAILLEKIQKHVKDEQLIDLTRSIVVHDCTKQFVYKGNPRLQTKVPPHKSLFQIPLNKGLPIGNLTSQFFANIYLNELDQYVKHGLKTRYYIRYVDDCILLDRSKESLLNQKNAIESFLATELSLTLKPEMILKRVNEGADFLGYIVRPKYVLVRNRVVGNLKMKLRHFRNKIVVQGAVGGNRYTIMYLREDILRELRQMLASYLGHFKHANAHRLIEQVVQNYGYLNNIFSLGEGYRLIPLYEPPVKPHRLANQYRWFQKTYNDYRLFFQVGKFCEFFGTQAERCSSLFGLRLREDSRGLGTQCGFLLRMLETFKNRALRAGQPYAVVAESGYYPSGLKRRVITEILTFNEGEEE